MKKLLKVLIASAAMFACAVTTTMALPSASNNGSVIGGGAKFESIPADLNTEAKAIVEKLNAGTSLAEVLKDVEITLPEGKKLADIKLLTNIQNLVATDGRTTNVEVSWEVPNLTTDKDIFVLHYSTVRNVWEILTPKAIDVAKHTVTTVFPDLSPVAVVHIPTSGTVDTKTPPTGDATNIALYAGVGVAALAVVAVMVYRNKKYN